jgi:hypothetical protein
MQSGEAKVKEGAMACSKDRDEAAACYGARMMDGKRRRRGSV